MSKVENPDGEDTQAPYVKSTSSQQKQTSSEVIADCSLAPLREIGSCPALGALEGLELLIGHQHNRHLLSAGAGLTE